MFRNIHIGITSSGNQYLFYILFVLFAALALWSYWWTVPPVSKFLRMLLSVLRIAAFGLFLLVLFKPVVHLTRRFTQKAVIGLLIDNSSSMQIEENGKKRGERILEMLRTKEFRTFMNRYALAPSLFTDHLVQLKENLPDSIIRKDGPIRFEGTATDIGRALQELHDQIRGSTLNGILLLSDGIINQGENPIRVGERIGLPVFSVTMGGTEQKSDLLITQGLTNEIAYANNQIPVSLNVRGPGFSGLNVPVIIRSGDEVLNQKTVTILPDGMETSIELHFTPKRPGFQKITAEIEKREGEISFENNAREFYIQVLKSKLEILLFAQAPSPDLAFFVRILSEDENFNLTVRTQKDGKSFYEGPFPTDIQTKAADMLILLDFPDRRTDMHGWEKIEEIILKEKKPFFIVVGQHVEWQELRSIHALLPFDQPEKTIKLLILPQLTEDGELHPVLRISENRDENRTLWGKLPPLYSTCHLKRIKPDCRVLALGLSEKQDPLAPQSGIPLILVRHIGEEKAVAFLGTGMFRWDLMMWGIGGTDEVVRTFLGNTVRWLSTREGNRSVRILSNHKIYHPGEEAILSAQIYDETYHPVAGARVIVGIESSGGKTVVQLRELENGLYQSTFRPFEKGMYRAIAEAEFQDRTLGRDTTGFSVTMFNPEFLDTRARPELLEALAVATGGKSGPSDSLSAVLKAIDFPPQRATSDYEIEFSRLTWILVIVLMILSLEWFIRKRKGMV